MVFVTHTSKLDRTLRNDVLGPNDVYIHPTLLLSHELIGLFVRIKRPCDQTFEEILGVVVDETKNTMVIETVSGLLKTVPKFGTEFTFILPSKNTEKGRISVKIQGKLLLLQPQNRIKNIKKLRN